MNFNKTLLEILACPLCKGPLIYVAERSELHCHHDQWAFPIRDGIPILLEMEARPLVSARRRKRVFDVVIPARLASSRLPRKILLDYRGKPLLFHAYEQAKQSQAARWSSPSTIRRCTVCAVITVLRSY